MALQLLKSTASSAKSLDHGPTWWIGWKVAGLNQWLVQLLDPQPVCKMLRVEKDGWVDFFLGHCADTGTRVHSILEGSSRVGLHFSFEDADTLFGQHCPSAEIPEHLWQLLQQEIQVCRS